MSETQSQLVTFEFFLGWWEFAATTEPGAHARLTSREASSEVHKTFGAWMADRISAVILKFGWRKVLPTALTLLHRACLGHDGFQDVGSRSHSPYWSSVIPR